jgi:hypothetical protein
LRLCPVALRFCGVLLGICHLWWRGHLTLQSEQENNRRFHDWPPCSTGITTFERQISPTLARPSDPANVSSHSPVGWNPVNYLSSIVNIRLP